MSDKQDLPSAASTRRRSRWRLLTGTFLTFVYLALATLLFARSATPVSQLRPNEVGDLLAGLFGPLALLWVILGYLQQGEELEHSTAALRQQAEELQLSVEQQRQLVEVTREQVNADRQALQDERDERSRAAQPIFDVKKVHALVRPPDLLETDITIANVGQEISSVRVYTKTANTSINDGLNNAWRRNEDLIFFANGPKDIREIIVEISYLDSLLHRHRQRFTIMLADAGTNSSGHWIFNAHISEVTRVDPAEPWTVGG